uniref:Uncharacterized protein n=1 Tax=Romanomermis culicivorax TaxID=13658 RepID=A0A915HQR3_ROMCU
MMVKGMSERFIRQLGRENVRHQVRLSKAHQHRLAAEQQLQGTPVTYSKNNACNTAEKTTTLDAKTTQKWKM